MGFLSEFKSFAMRGNVVDLAVGVIIGGAFGKIVSSVVDDLIMPVVSIFLGDKGFKDKFYVFGDKAFDSLAQAKEAGVPVFAYGNFIQTVIDFTILAFIIFMMIKGMNNLKKKEEAAAPTTPPAPSNEEVLLAEIRDLLKK
jgi:large conductance mechanosensitive channel